MSKGSGRKKFSNVFHSYYLSKIVARNMHGLLQYYDFVCICIHFNTNIYKDIQISN